MKATILNREFQHPADGWYQIEPKGSHPNRAAGVVQVIDEEAAKSIVNRFNADATAGKLRQGSELLIDHEHFSDQPDQESRAYGWLQELQNRADGIYGRIRWTTTGKAAVDGGDYRFFSTEYAPEDLAEVKIKNSKLKSVRPLKLDGLTLTNMNNNRGQKPITNRAQFRSPAAADSQQQPQTTGQKMKTVCTLLELSADASEEAVHAAVAKLKNRIIVLEPMEADNTKLKNRIAEIDAEQVAGLLAGRKVTDAKIVNRLTPVLLGLKNREERIAFLDDCNIKAEPAKPAGRVLNRETGKPAEAAAGTQAEAVTTEALNAEVRKIMNRDSVKFEPAYNTLRREKPELFQPADNAS